MRTHLSSVAEENKLSDSSGNVGVCENPQADASVGAIAGAGKKPVCVKAALGRLRCWWEDNIKKNLKELDCDAGDWIDIYYLSQRGIGIRFWEAIHLLLGRFQK